MKKITMIALFFSLTTLANEQDLEIELSAYDLEKILIEKEIKKLEREAEELTIEEKKSKYFKNIEYEDFVERDDKYEKKLRDLPMFMLEKTDVIEITF